MAKNKALSIVGIIVVSVLLVGGGVIGGKMMSNKSSDDSKESSADIKGSNEEQTAVSELDKPEEKLVGKTGVCNTGEVKYIGSGNYVVGVDLASGEYVAQHNPKNGDTGSLKGISMYVYSSKAEFTADRYMSKTAEVVTFDTVQQKNVKLDEGNYIEVKIDGMLTCK